MKTWAFLATFAIATYPSERPRIELILSAVVFSDFEIRRIENERGENDNKFAQTGRRMEVAGVPFQGEWYDTKGVF